MVTVEQGGDQLGVYGGVTQTQNPQALVPSNLQPNQASGIQTVLASPNLFANPQQKAIVNVSGSNGLTAQSLLANEADNRTTSSSDNVLIAVLIGAIIVIAIGSYLIMKKLPRNW